MSIIHLRETSLPFVRQTHPSSCGAACLTMIYQHFGLDLNEECVFQDVIGIDVRGGQNCRTYLMCQDAINKGYAAIAFRADDVRNTIKACRENDIELIVLFHASPGSLAAHFCVINNVLPGGVYLKDPKLDETREKSLKFRELDNLMQATHLPGDDICGNNTMIAISKNAWSSGIQCKNPKCRHFIPMIPEIEDHIQHVICPYCDSAFPL